MDEMLYHQPGAVIALAILALMLLAMEAGFRIGRRGAAATSGDSKSQISTVQTSLIGLLALMLGFTFSIALDRFNSRSLAVVDETNAIGTSYLRALLLPEPFRTAARRTMTAYVELRAKASSLPWDEPESRRRMELDTLRLQRDLWRQAVAAARLEPNPVTTGLYVQALNETIDSYGRHAADIERHVPEFVLLMLVGAFIVTGGIIGYSAGLSGHRPAHATYMMIGLVVVLMFMVMDLDRPQRGVIQVDTRAFHDLKAVMEGEGGTGD